MRRSHQSASCLQKPSLKRAGSLALLAFAASCLPLHSQTSAPAPDQAQPAPATLPAVSAPDAPDSQPVITPVPQAPSPGTGTITVFQNQPPTSSASGGTSASAPSWNTSMQNVLLPSYPFGLFVAPTAGGTGFNSAGGFGSGRMGAGSFADHQPAPRAFNPLGSTGIGRRQPSISPLYSPRNASAHGLPGGYTGFAVSPGALTSLNQMLRGSFNLPLNSSAGSFRFTYQNVLRPGVSLAGLDHPSASLMFSTSGLGNGMVFSAGTSYGSHSLPSTPAANLGAVPAADPKHSGPTVNLKLSF